jgi:hypothetical protein
MPTPCEVDHGKQQPSQMAAIDLDNRNDPRVFLQIWITGMIRGFSFSRKSHSQEQNTGGASMFIWSKVRSIVFWASSLFCAGAWYFERNCEPQVGPDTWVCPATTNHQPPCHANEAVSLAPILTMLAVFLIKSFSKANHPMVLFIDRKLEKDKLAEGEVPPAAHEPSSCNRRQQFTSVAFNASEGDSAPGESETGALQEQLKASDVGFRIGHVHDLKLDLILAHYPFVGQFCGCCVRSSLWQTMKRQYPTRDGKSLQFVLAQKCLWDNHLKDVKGLSHGRGELAGGKYLCYNCRNNFEEVPAQPYTNWFMQLDQSIILLVSNLDVYGREVLGEVAPATACRGKTKTVILRRFKKPDSAHSDVQILPFKLNRTRAANGTWKLEPQPNEASRYPNASQVHPNSWAQFSKDHFEAQAGSGEKYFLNSINGVNVSETKYALYIDHPNEADSTLSQLETDLAEKRKLADLKLTFSVDRSIMQSMGPLNEGEMHGITFKTDSTGVEAYDRLNDKDGDLQGRFDGHSLHAVIDAKNVVHRAKEESCRRDLGEFLNKRNNTQLPRPIRLVFKPQKKELDWKEIAMKVVRLSSFLAELKHWRLRLFSEWILPIVRGVVPVLMLEQNGLSSDYSMAGHGYGAIEVMACISTCFWTRELLCALNRCRTVYLEQAEAQKILSILYQKPQHNHMPYEAWLESLQAHVGRSSVSDADIRGLIEAYNTRPGEPLLDFTHPSQGRMQMWMYSMCRSTMRVQHKIHQARCTTVVGVLLAGVVLMTVIGFSRHCKLNYSRLP